MARCKAQQGSQPSPTLEMIEAGERAYFNLMNKANPASELGQPSPELVIFKAMDKLSPDPFAKRPTEHMRVAGERVLHRLSAEQSGLCEPDSLQPDSYDTTPMVTEVYLTMRAASSVAKVLAFRRR